MSFFAHTEIGGSASFYLLGKWRNWCASTSPTFTHIYERCCQSLEGFIKLMQRCPREREKRFLQITIQRPGALIDTLHLVSYTVSTLDTDSPTTLSRWDAATTSSQQIIIQTLNECTFGVRCGKWCDTFRRKILSSLR